MKASDLFVEALEYEGVDFIFGIPGEENLDFLDSLSRSKIRLILTRHEQAAGFMASTYGRLTGKAGRRLSFNAWSWRNQLRYCRSLRSTWRDADADDYWSKAGENQQARTIPNR